MPDDACHSSQIPISPRHTASDPTKTCLPLLARPIQLAPDRYDPAKPHFPRPEHTLRERACRALRFRSHSSRSRTSRDSKTPPSLSCLAPPSRHSCSTPCRTTPAGPSRAFTWIADTCPSCQAFTLRSQCPGSPLLTYPVRSCPSFLGLARTTHTTQNLTFSQLDWDSNTKLLYPRFQHFSLRAGMNEVHRVIISPLQLPLPSSTTSTREQPYA